MQPEPESKYRAQPAKDSVISSCSRLTIEDEHQCHGEDLQTRKNAWKFGTIASRGVSKQHLRQQAM